MSKLHFTVHATHGHARAGTMLLNGVSVQTPAFMPVGTKATIKGLMLDMLRDSRYLGELEAVNIILANTFHLYLRPGADIVGGAGGLHRFENRDKLILTDSGGFQVFSLGLSKSDKPLFKLHPDGVHFRSPHDGSAHSFTPTQVVDIQSQLGSDIMMMLDVCSPVAGITKDVVAQQMQLTHQRAKKAFDHMSDRYDQVRGCLFPIVQWGLYPDLREESCRTLSEYAIDGIAIGGLSVGETKEEMRDILIWLDAHLPHDKPRYLMGVGSPEELLMAIDQWVDMFDCVMPTRLGRHGVGMQLGGNIKITNQCYQSDYTALDAECRCHTCRHYTRSYLHHLFRAGEMLGGILLSLHNISYLHHLVQKKHKEIMDQSAV